MLPKYALPEEIAAATQAERDAWLATCWPAQKRRRKLTDEEADDEIHRSNNEWTLH